MTLLAVPDPGGVSPTDVAPPGSEALHFMAMVFVVVTFLAFLGALVYVALCRHYGGRPPTPTDWYRQRQLARSQAEKATAVLHQQTLAELEDGGWRYRLVADTLPEDVRRAIEEGTR